MNVSHIPPQASTAGEARGLLVLIPAWNEASVIGDTLRRVREAAGPHDVVVVIDDCSSDGTAVEAARAGARVMRRSAPHPQPLPPKGGGEQAPPLPPYGGKGPGDEGRSSTKAGALKWWAEAAGANFAAFAGIVILDADTRVDAGFLESVRARLARGEEAIQGFVVPVVEGHSAARMAGLSEWIEQALDDRWRSALGWPVRLRGTGMALRPDHLLAMAPRLSTVIEDVEMSLLLARRGIRVHFAAEARVFDPKPSHSSPAARQRARWLRGQGEVLRRYRVEIARLLLDGPPAWSLLQCTLLKPRSLIVPLKVGLTSLALAGWVATGSPVLAAIAGLLSLSLVLDAVHHAIGMLMFGGRAALILGLSSVPGYVLMWLRSAALSLHPPGAWFRARDS